MNEEDLEAFLMRQALSEITLEIQRGGAYEGIFANVDLFVELSKGNNVVEKV
jgi:hypothetical protein